MPYKAGPLYPSNPATERAMSTKLGVDPKGEKLIYTNGRAVIIRDLNHTNLTSAYSQHTQSATVARFSPSGYYAASADVAGNVKVWDPTQLSNQPKLDIRALGGRINDLAWDGESKRIIVGGEGKDKFGAAFFMDSGTSCGEISGHAKAITSLSVRHQRPFRAVSGSDDNSVVLHTAVPFKYDKMISTHNRFVRDVAYSPNGELFVSVGSDGKMVVYEGKDGAVKADFDRGGSTSSLMAAAWNNESTKIATAGADGIVTIWDASAQKVAQTYNVGSDIPSQQNGVIYANPNIVVSVSLSGTLNVFDTRESDTTKWRELHGATKAITAGVLSSGNGQTFYAGSFDGTLKAFDFNGKEDGQCREVKGTGHTALIASLADGGEGKVWSAGWDDKVASIENAVFGSTSIATKAQPRSVAATPNAVYTASAAGLEVHPVSGGSSIQAGETCAVAAFAGSADIIAYGNGKKVILSAASGGKINVEAEFDDNKGEVLVLAFSPDGSLLAAGDAAGRIILIDVKGKSVNVSSRWTFHTGRINALAFSPSGKRIASAGADEAIYIWETDKVMKNTAIKNAHPGGVSGVAWKGGETDLISTGADGCVRTWEVETV